MRLADLAGKRVAVWGCGREGQAALAALRARLPGQRVGLFCSDEETARLPDRDGLDLGGAAPDADALAAFELVVKSPGISAYRPELLAAAARGTRFVSGTALWFGEHPAARVIAVTGTKGKSTVASLVAHCLRGLGRRTALAGNIGLPLLELLDPPQAPDWWVVELSSFQTREPPAVDVAVINNLYEEHLDWHGTRARYAADKLALAGVARTLVLNWTQPELVERIGAHPHRIAFGDAGGWHVADGAVRRGTRRVLPLEGLPLAGAHNARNVSAALAALEAAGEDALAAAAAVATFRPLPHRLQRLGGRDGLVWVDDSIATTPQATLEALASFAGAPVAVLVGGFDRGLDWQPFAHALRGQPPALVVTMGANGDRIAALLHERGGFRVASTFALADAVRLAREALPPGGVVLLSPGAPSFDQFRDYAERGRAFATLAGFPADAIGAIPGLGIA